MRFLASNCTLSHSSAAVLRRAELVLERKQDELANTAIGARAGSAIYLRDVTRVADGGSDESNYVLSDRLRELRGTQPANDLKVNITRDGGETAKEKAKEIR